MDDYSFGSLLAQPQPMTGFNQPNAQASFGNPGLFGATPSGAGKALGEAKPSKGKSDKGSKERKAWEDIISAVAAVAGGAQPQAEVMGGHSVGEGRQMDPSAMWAAIHSQARPGVEISPLGSLLGR